MRTRLPPIISLALLAMMLLPAHLSGADVPLSPVRESPHAPAGTCTVTSNADSGPGTLRNCLTYAVNGDTITFNPSVFPPNNPVTIALASALPDISQGNLTIDASNAGVILDGSGTSGNPDTDGLIVSSGGNAIRGLQVVNFPRIGIHLVASAENNTIGGDSNVGVGPSGRGNVIGKNGGGGIYIGGGRNNIIVGNRIGVTANGSAPLGHYDNGILLREGAQNNRIGGTTVGERNIISGNRSDGIALLDSGTMSNTIIGNFVGTDILGTVAISNTGSGVSIQAGAQNNRIGGSTASERNVISGNGGDGIFVNGSVSNAVVGNYIGTNASGTIALANGRHGVEIFGGAWNNTIGGSTASERNIISGNGEDGIRIAGAGTISNTVKGNYIGTDVSGAAAIGNSQQGICMYSGPSHNLIGGKSSSERNVISANGQDGVNINGASSNIVSGNYIGLDASGTFTVPNQSNGVWIGLGAQGNVIGGTTPGERNIISGNASGVWMHNIGTSNNIVIGNYIGTNASGTAALGNIYNGVGMMDGPQHNRVGGTTPGERNLISGNGGGVYLTGGSTMYNTISGNHIGTDASGLAVIGQRWYGIQIAGGARENIVGGATAGERNVISGNTFQGIYIYDTGTMSNTIIGNYIGTNVNGTAGLPNGDDGISIRNASNNTIGGNTPGLRNLISGNGSNGIGLYRSDTMSNTIVGNYIGTNVSGTAAISNTSYGVFINGARYNRIGGSNATPSGACMGECNLISGNEGGGVGMYDTMSNIVSGNYIGTNASGTAALGNRENGVQITHGAANNTIGGSTDGQRNVISGNGCNGVTMHDSGTADNIVRGNYIGTNATGTAALPNSVHGINISAGASYNVVGGDIPAKRNIVSGNGNSGIGIWGTGTMSNTVRGNYVGTDVSGSVAITNTYNDVAISGGAQHNIIGGTNAGERNILSGSGNGVYIGDTGTMYNVVIGNYIGTDVSGTKVLGHYWQGVCIRNGAQRNRIGGTAPGERNIISGSQNGVQIGGGPGTDENLVIGNYIGIDASGTTALGNNSNGVYIWEQSQRNRVEANVIGGNANGVWLVHTGTMTNTIVGNLIGTDASGVSRFPNWQGVNIDTGTQGNMIGPGNIVAYNRNGVRVRGLTTLGNTITQNSIHDNDDVTGPAIDNVSGGNAELPPPVITQMTGGNAITGTACAGCIVEVFSDDAEEGRVFEGSTTADGSGNLHFSKPGGFTLLNVTTTARDAAGNTSEFSTPKPHALPVINQVIPNQGMNNTPNEVNILGLNLGVGITATLSTTPPTPLTVQFIANTHIRAIIPVSVPVGTFALTVANPGGGSATLADAYTAFAPVNDDLFGYSYELWTDPPTLQTNHQGGIGLVVHRQGGKTALSNVVVRFYQGNPGQGGTVIGDGTIVLMSPNSSASTPKVNWTPPAAGTYDLYAMIDPDNAITETIESNNVVSRTVAVLPSAPDQIAPHVDSFTINDGAAFTRFRNVTLDATASDNPGGSGVASLLYVEFEYSQAAGQWIPVQNSGWVAYTTASSNYPWLLLPVAGMRYMQAWAADAARNISLYPYRAYINYLPSSDHVGQGQVRVYRRNVAAGQALTVQVTPISGDPDLYIWPPDWPVRPPWASYLDSGVDQVSFTAPVSGVYQIEVYGYTAADYQISISVALANDRQRPAVGGARFSKTPRTSPALPVSSVPGEQIALPLPVLRLYLPVILRNH